MEIPIDINVVVIVVCKARDFTVLVVLLVHSQNKITLLLVRHETDVRDKTTVFSTGIVPRPPYHTISYHRSDNFVDCCKADI